MCSMVSSEKLMANLGITSNSSVYVETSVISYLTALPSRDVVAVAHQEITRAWWDGRARFELFISQTVLDASSAVCSSASLAARAALNFE
jgi:hypothetical protein